MWYGCSFQAFPPNNIDLSNDGTFTLSFNDESRTLSSYDCKKKLTTMAFQENFPAENLDR